MPMGSHVSVPKTYQGVRLSTLMEAASPTADATTFVMTADDGYIVEVPFCDVQECADCLVAFRDQGGLRMVLPGTGSSSWVKGVVGIELK